MFRPIVLPLLAAQADQGTTMKKLNWKQAWAAKCQLLLPNARLPRGIKQVKVEVEGPAEADLGRPYGPRIWDETPHIHNFS